MTHQLLDHIEALTQQRDISLLDVSITNALVQLLQTNMVRLRQIYNRETGLAAVTTAWNDGTHVQSLGDMPNESDFESLDNLPGLQKCLAAGGAFAEHNAKTRTHHYWFPVYMQGSPYACAEIVSDKKLTLAKCGMVEGIMGVYRNFLSLLDDSQRDGLTGLANRKAFDRSLRRLLTTVGAKDKVDQERRHASGRENWLAIVDVDFFKRVNDAHGHLTGDKALIELADIMRKSFRVQDRLFRFGGDEFVILIRHATAEHVATSLERFRGRVEKHPIDPIGNITISAGYAPIKADDTPTTVIGHADSAHYNAKHQGRNRVRGYNAP